MEKVVSITSGDNLKRIRKELGLKQQEIVGDDITRNLISMIENNKSPMSYTIAKVISDNINKISKEENMGVYIDTEDIMNPQRMEAKSKADRYIKDMKKQIEDKTYNLDESYLEKLEVFLNKWNIPEKKVEIYGLIGDICYYNNDLEGEYLYLNKSLENYYIIPIKDDMYVIVAKLITNCINTERYHESLRLVDLDFIKYNKNIPNIYKANFCYNKALSYKRINMYDEAMELIYYFERHFSDDTRLLKKVMIVKGICYYYKNEDDKAIEVYKEIINKYGEESDEVGLAYANIIDLFIIKDKKEGVIEYRNKLKHTIKNMKKDNKYLTKIYYNLAQACEYLYDIDLAEYYYISALDKAVGVNDTEQRAKSLHAIIKLYGKTNQLDKISAIDDILKRYFDDIMFTDDMKLVLELISINLKINRHDKVHDIINYLIKGGNK